MCFLRNYTRPLPGDGGEAAPSGSRSGGRGQGAPLEARGPEGPPLPAGVAAAGERAGSGLPPAPRTRLRDARGSGSCCPPAAGTSGGAQPRAIRPAPPSAPRPHSTPRPPPRARRQPPARLATRRPSRRLCPGGASPGPRGLGASHPVLSPFLGCRHRAGGPPARLSQGDVCSRMVGHFKRPRAEKGAPGPGSQEEGSVPTMATPLEDAGTRASERPADLGRETGWSTAGCGQGALEAKAACSGDPGTAHAAQAGARTVPLPACLTQTERPPFPARAPWKPRRAVVPVSMGHPSAPCASPGCGARALRGTRGPRPGQPPARTRGAPGAPAPPSGGHCCRVFPFHRAGTRPAWSSVSRWRVPLTDKVKIINFRRSQCVR